MTHSDPGAVEFVTSVGDLDSTVVALREYLHLSAAIRAMGVIERAEGTAAVVDCPRLEPIRVDFGDRVVQLAHTAQLDAPVPALPDVRMLPAFEVDPSSGEVIGTIGGLHRLVDGVRTLADALGGSNIALAVFETTNAALPLAVTVRAGSSEDPVITLGDEQFELPGA
ncbi:unannotated protein [freshwater metagenome]|uniref:Unannotated protein n=1 Tax=freshwater metagenome TaxID=449393 RepID=A0A6J7HUU2_9ZZZZ|nr:hypothetical protein [Actinomycetota bacterium]